MLRSIATSLVSLLGMACMVPFHLWLIHGAQRDVFDFSPTIDYIQGKEPCLDPADDINYPINDDSYLANASFGTKAFLNLQLWLLFGCIHTATAQQTIRKRLQTLLHISENTYRCLYTLLSGVMLLTVAKLWIPINGTLIRLPMKTWFGMTQRGEYTFQLLCELLHLLFILFIVQLLGFQAFIGASPGSNALKGNGPDNNAHTSTNTTTKNQKGRDTNKKNKSQMNHKSHKDEINTKDQSSKKDETDRTSSKDPTNPMHTPEMNLHKSTVCRQSNSKRLITTGIYGYVRHPMYTITLSFCLCSSILTMDRILVALCMYAYLYAFGIEVEEIKLIQEFGEEYKEYRQYVPAMIPYKCCYRKSTPQTSNKPTLNKSDIKRMTLYGQSITVENIPISSNKTSQHSLNTEMIKPNPSLQPISADNTKSTEQTTVHHSPMSRSPSVAKARKRRETHD